VRAAVVHGVDDGDAGYLEPTLGGAPGRSRSPQSKAVENTHCKTRPICHNARSENHEYEYIFMILTI
jgi:hypothetical protein